MPVPSIQTFEDERDAEDAVRGCNGQDIRGSRVRVEMAKNRGGGGAGPRGVRSTGGGGIYGSRSDDDNYKRSRYVNASRIVHCSSLLTPFQHLVAPRGAAATPCQASGVIRLSLTFCLRLDAAGFLQFHTRV